MGDPGGGVFRGIGFCVDSFVLSPFLLRSLGRDPICGTASTDFAPKGHGAGAADP